MLVPFTSRYCQGKPSPYAGKVSLPKGTAMHYGGFRRALISESDVSDDFETVKQVATHPLSLSSVAAVFAWLMNKVWRVHRHEMANVKDSVSKQGEWLGKLYEKLDQHIREDNERFEKHGDGVKELLKRMDDHHAAILTAIGNKADR